MWYSVIDWFLTIISGISQYAVLLFTPMSDFAEVAEDMGAIPGLDSNALLKFFVNLVPGWRLIDMLSLAGLIVILCIYIIKKVDPFGG